jgi:adenylate cyclase
MNVAVDAEPDTVVGSVVFTDLVGFTEFNGAAGDAAALAVLDTQTRLVHSVLGECAGSRLVKEIGDGLMLWFASPADAVHCSLAMLDAIDRYRSSEHFPLAVRMGGHHGPAIVRGEDLVGQTVNIAARISDLAGPGELLVSDELIGACQALAAQAHPIGAAQVKGVEHPIWLHRVTPAG